jgi:hypothetical protein
MVDADREGRVGRSLCVWITPSMRAQDGKGRACWDWGRTDPPELDSSCVRCGSRSRFPARCPRRPDRRIFCILDTASGTECCRAEEHSLNRSWCTQKTCGALIARFVAQAQPHAWELSLPRAVGADRLEMPSLCAGDGRARDGRSGKLSGTAFCFTDVDQGSADWWHSTISAAGMADYPSADCLGPAVVPYF